MGNNNMTNLPNLPESFIVLNFSGNVGKSTIVTNVLSPRMQAAEIITVESLNEGDGREDKEDGKRERITARNARRIFEKVAMAEDGILVDVGSSNIELLINEFQRFQGAEELFDLWVIPTIGERKQFQDTCQTILFLNTLGIPKERIRVVMNRADPKNLKEQFSALFSFHREHPIFMLSDQACLPECEVYEIAKASRLVVYDVANGKRDYRSEMKEADDIAEKERLARMYSVSLLAKSQEAAHERVWNALVNGW